ncbi:MAG: toxin ParE1/3/4 [Thermoanaerobaculia bacterium]|nr:toxin ParE1/3/4 [Thermoanaerobaculia bacterium]
MSKPVRTNPFADDDIFSHIQYYAARSPFLSERLWNEVQTAFKLISEYPLIGEVVPRARVRGTARRVLLRHFPFFVIYRNHEDYVEVMALAHTSRKPYYWRGRFN